MFQEMPHSKYQSDKLNETFLQLASLKDGWCNGVGKAPNPKCLAMARSILRKLRENIGEEPDVGASEEGYVDLTWRKRLYFTLELDDDEICFVFRFVENDNIRTEELTFNYPISSDDLEKVSNKIEDFLLKNSTDK